MAIARRGQAAQPAEQAFVPFNQFSHGGGLLDDVDVTITDSKFVEWDYNGKIDHNIPALCWELEYLDAEGGTQSVNQFWSAGDLNNFVPTDDGRGLIAVANTQTINDSTNVYQLFQSLFEAGMPEDHEIMTGGDASAFIGMQLHVNRRAQPKRQGLLLRGGGNQGREDTVLLVTEILAYPGEEAAQPAEQPQAPARRAAPAPARPAARTAAPPQRQAAPARPTPAARPSSAPASAARPAAASRPSASAPRAGTRTSPSNSRPNKANGSANADGLIENVARTILTELLVDANGQARKVELHKLAFRKAGEKVQAGALDPKQKNAVVQMIFTDQFLHQMVEEGVIQTDGAEITLVAEQQEAQG